MNSHSADMGFFRTTALAIVAFGAAALLLAGCAPRAIRGGEGTAYPDYNRRAMSVTLDRDDITYLVADYLENAALLVWNGFKEVATAVLGVAIKGALSSLAGEVGDKIADVAGEITD